MTANIENPCISSGCKGGCCQNIRLEQVPAKDLSLFVADGETNATEIPAGSIEMYSRMSGRRRRNPRPSDGDKNRVYYGQERPGIYTVIFIGPCPNLASNGACKIYDRRPIQCSAFEVGGAQCNDIRKFQGLPIIATTIPKRQGIK